MNEALRETDMPGVIRMGGGDIISQVDDDLEVITSFNLEFKPDFITFGCDGNLDYWSELDADAANDRRLAYIQGERRGMAFIAWAMNPQAALEGRVGASYSVPVVFRRIIDDMLRDSACGAQPEMIGFMTAIGSGFISNAL